MVTAPCSLADVNNKVIWNVGKQIQVATSKKTVGHPDNRNRENVKYRLLVYSLNANML